LTVLFVLELVMNILSFTFFGVDKRKAITNRWRISEKVLLLISLIGPLGSILGMKLFRHKTKKISFKILVPGFLLIHITLLIYVFNLL
jgi:uncharacterized membrane protein YsdA (DUF1294 family)